MERYEEILVFAAVFLVLFIIGGVIGVATLPEWVPGRFFIGGLPIGAFGTGMGTFVIKVIWN